MRTTLLLMMVVTLGACTFGPRARQHPLATSPAGVTAHVDAAGRALTGELITVTDSSLVLRVDQEFFEIPFRVVNRGYTLPAPTVMIAPALRNERDRAALRRMSRYPQGLSRDLLADLLRAYDQPRLQRLGEGAT